MAAKKKEKLEAADESQETTFIALMLLLLCFMVILVSLAQMEGPRFRKAIGSVHGAFSMLTSQSGQPAMIDGGPGVLPASSRDLSEDALNLKRKIDTLLDEDMRSLFRVDLTEDGVRLTLGSLVLFDLGRAMLKPGASPVLDEVVYFLKEWTGSTTVVGHTCDLPIHTVLYPSNWDLSMSRAVEVVRYLESRGIEPSQLAAMGKADSSPIAPNDEEHREMNRRVEIILECEPACGGGA